MQRLVPFTVTALVAACLLPRFADGAPDTRALAECARGHYDARSWELAAEAYDQLLAANPYDGAHWQNCGFALHSLRRYPEAIAAFERSRELGTQPHLSLYNIACGKAQLGEITAAIDALELALAGRFVEQEDLLRTDSDLDPLRDHPRFKKLAGIPPEGLDRDARWRFDLAHLDRRLRAVHHDLFGVMSERVYAAALADLERSIPDRTDHEIMVGIQRILAMIGDGHTSLRPPHSGPLATRRFPIELHDFADGLHVIGAGGDAADAVGGKVLEVGEVPVDEAVARVSEICSVDNPMGYRNLVPRLMAIPELLHALEIIDDPDRATMLVRTPAGEERRVTLAAAPRGAVAIAVRADDGSAAPLPRFLRRADEAYWFEAIPGRKTVYFQFNQVRDDDDESIAQFTERLGRLIEEQEIDHLIIDMRLNGGGNNFLNQPLVHGLIRCERLHHPTGLFVIVGRQTFSAAMNGVTDIETHLGGIFAGEPTGSKPNFVGESTMITLPCSQLRLSCSSLYWQRSHAFDDRIWIAPSIVAEPSFADYRERRDPVMEAVLEAIPTAAVSDAAP